MAVTEIGTLDVKRSPTRQGMEKTHEPMMECEAGTDVGRTVLSAAVGFVDPEWRLAVRGFGELESAIMDVMWSRGVPATVREVLEQLQGQRDSAYTTVMTVMGILHGKGWLSRERDGRAWRYAATTTREAYAARLMREALHDGADTAAVLAHFVAEASPEESEALRRFLDRGNP